MELKRIIEAQKKTIIFEDTEFRSRQEIDSASIDFGFYLELIGDYSGEIIIISKSDNRMDIFEEAINKNITIDYVSTGKLRNQDYDISKFKNKVVLFDKCFDGMTSTLNNIFININKISNISKKFIAVDVIGENFLYVDYFTTFLKLLNIELNINFYDSDSKKLNEILLENFVIIENENIVKSIDKNYWCNLSSENQNQNIISVDLSGFDVSDKIKKNIKQNNNRKKPIFDNNFENYKKNGIYLNKTLYVVLAIFFGGLGFHKFYAKKYIFGVIYLLLVCTYIPIFLSIYEGIKAIGMEQNSLGQIYIK